ncbi:MAG: cob(I)yrinic acid a,c-diamide adenosyltransferase [Bradymonadales bacterium]|nr:MAG: cob(I)yrinic acid a,c-diamide adenosyltransferase [Bradymonadales bacterium]
MKIYTKTGDKGQSGLFSGERLPKSSSYFEAYGSVDELNAFLGWAASICSSDELRNLLQQIQNCLHLLSADLATPLDSSKKIERLESAEVVILEKGIDQLEEELQPLKNFILAGGTELASRLHICRCVARRAEREVCRHSQAEEVNPVVIQYLNRLSDLLFVMARVANRRGGVEDVLWKS